MTMPEKKTTRFAPGVSGNPKGKPRGTRHKATELALKLMQDDANDVVRAVINSAKGGDMTAARIIIERLAPPLRERPVSLELPDTSTVEGIEKAQGVILDAVGAGELLPGEGTTLSALVENRRRSIETLDLEQRISALEGKWNGRLPP